MGGGGGGVRQQASAGTHSSPTPKRPSGLTCMHMHNRAHPFSTMKKPPADHTAQVFRLRRGSGLRWQLTPSPPPGQARHGMALTQSYDSDMGRMPEHTGGAHGTCRPSTHRPAWSPLVHLREGAGVDVEPTPDRGAGSASTTDNGVPAGGAADAGGGRGLGGVLSRHVCWFLLPTLYPLQIHHTIPAQQL